MSLTYTGERLVELKRNLTSIEHLQRYLFASNLIKNKVVLDIASGEGYGSFLLSKTAQQVYGVDISKASIEHAKLTYNASNLQFIEGSVFHIPLPDESIDVIISFETLEHVNEHNETMLECRRILRNNGVIIISTPDKYFYSDVDNYKNPFHVKELYKDEFLNLITKYFKNAFLFRQGSVKGTIIYSAEETHGGSGLSFFKGNYPDLVNASDIEKPLFNIIIASDGKLDLPQNLIYETEYVDFESKKAVERLQLELMGIHKSKTYQFAKLIIRVALPIKKMFFRWMR